MRQTIGYALAAASVVFASRLRRQRDSSTSATGRSTAAVLGASLADYAGKWDGHAEAYEFNDGSDRIRLSIDEDGDGRARGRRFAGVAGARSGRRLSAGCSRTSHKGLHRQWRCEGFYPGFEYPIDGANVESKRIRFKATDARGLPRVVRIADADPERRCDSEGYSCAPGGLRHGMATRTATCTTGDGDTPIDCGKLRCASQRLHVRRETSCNISDPAGLAVRRGAAIRRRRTRRHAGHRRRARRRAHDARVVAASSRASRAFLDRRRPRIPRAGGVRSSLAPRCRHRRSSAPAPLRRSPWCRASPPR